MKTEYLLLFLKHEGKKRRWDTFCQRHEGICGIRGTGPLIPTSTLGDASSDSRPHRGTTYRRALGIPWIGDSCGACYLNKMTIKFLSASRKPCYKKEYVSEIFGHIDMNYIHTLLNFSLLQNHPHNLLQLVVYGLSMSRWGLRKRPRWKYTITKLKN